MIRFMLLVVPLGLGGCSTVDSTVDDLLALVGVGTPPVESPEPEGHASSETGSTPPDFANAAALGPAAGPPAEVPPTSEAGLQRGAVPETTLDHGSEAQIALLPAVGSTGVEARITFAEQSAELSEPARAELGRVAELLAADQSRHVQLLAFAQDMDAAQVDARRVSLTRALVVRAYLLERGVEPARLNLRSLAVGGPDGPPDRVDILLN